MPKTTVTAEYRSAMPPRWVIGATLAMLASSVWLAADGDQVGAWVFLALFLAASALVVVTVVRDVREDRADITG